MSTIENIADGSATQVMVSTTGKIFSGKNVAKGGRAKQIGGYMSDTSLQRLSHDVFELELASLENQTLQSRRLIDNYWATDSEGRHDGDSPILTPASTSTSFLPETRVPFR